MKRTNLSDEPSAWTVKRRSRLLGADAAHLPDLLGGLAFHQILSKLQHAALVEVVDLLHSGEEAVQRVSGRVQAANGREPNMRPRVQSTRRVVHV